jgi:5-formyltetrahydrofolate cyclo-ligase
MTKEELRCIMKKKRNFLSMEQQKSLSAKINEKLYNMEAFRISSVIFTYVSFGNEADTKAVIKKALSCHKKVFIPRVEGKVINFYKISGLESLSVSKFGISEPDPSIREPYSSADDKGGITLMILPGLAFDYNGNRVGFGAGYYDRYLSKYRDNFIKIAFAYDFQVVDHIETDEFDVKADLIITPERIIDCKINPERTE